MNLYGEILMRMGCWRRLRLRLRLRPLLLLDPPPHHEHHRRVSWVLSNSIPQTYFANDKYCDFYLYVSLGTSWQSESCWYSTKACNYFGFTNITYLTCTRCLPSTTPTQVTQIILRMNLLIIHIHTNTIA